jgi:hypothetical protein
MDDVAYTRFILKIDREIAAASFLADTREANPFAYPELIDTRHINIHLPQEICFSHGDNAWKLALEHRS